MYTMGEMLDADTGKMVKGHWTAGVNSKKVLLRNVTARWMHIKSNPDHFKVYKCLCETNQVATHPRATPDHIWRSVKGDAMEQTTLNGFETKIPAFTMAGMLDHLVELVVSEDNVFRLVDKGPFRLLMHYMRPSLQETDLPHRTKMTSEVLKRTKKVEASLMMTGMHRIICLGSFRTRIYALSYSKFKSRRNLQKFIKILQVHSGSNLF
ncbi:Dimer-Tnp-hAT domain-containing protein [Mycena venus]|uniref:Dimer-Tnp-hAT domain-containing protein n=1 Tax=Mycena venus TaxID=2733690 RepID=A0A8H6Z6W2_9AGAR|nr:Dimer-Tnp-hAT domain-containing protein [Mycena venus]